MPNPELKHRWYLEASRGNNAGKEYDLAGATFVFRICEPARPSAGTDVSGVAVGIVEDYEYPTVSTTLEEGESVVLYSDGISEAMNSRYEQYSMERIGDQLAAIQGGAAEIGQTLLDDVRKHAAGHQQSDDISLVVFGRAAE